MNKPTRKTMSVSALVSHDEVNIRDANNYDLPQMIEGIRTAGRILKPIICDENNVVLSGNRRTRAGQWLLEQPDCPSDLKEALQKVDVIVYAGLTEAERLALIIDHGSEKPISRSEVVTAVWRLDKQFFSEFQIAQMLYFALAKYSGNERKLSELSTNPAERQKQISKWFRGTLGNYILSAARMGDFVREQFLLTHQAEDKLLPVGVTVQMKCSRERILALSAAKTKDSKDNNWTTENGGPAFNALIEQFKAEDAGEPVVKVNRMSAKELKDKANIFKSAAIRNTLLVAAGDQDAGRGLQELDDQLNRWTIVQEVLAKMSPAVKDENVKAFIAALLGNGPAADVETALKPFTA